jgi:hypothetical protein
MGLHPRELGRFTRTGADMGYKVDGDDEGIAGAKSKDCKNDRSEEVMEKMSVSVNLDRA